MGTRHNPPQLTDTLDENLLPIGGNGLVIFNAELRVPVAGGLGVVGFVDTGNVFARVTDIDLEGVADGGRQRRAATSRRSGPIRFDLGFKVNRQPGESADGLVHQLRAGLLRTHEIAD